MTIGIGTLSARRRPVRVITAVYPVQKRHQRRLLARNAGRVGRLAALGVALIITAFALFATGGSDETQVSSGLPVIVPEARAGYSVDLPQSAHALELLLGAEGNA